MAPFIYVLFGIFTFCVVGLALDVTITALRDRVSSEVEPAQPSTTRLLAPDKPDRQREGKQEVAREL